MAWILRETEEFAHQYHKIPPEIQSHFEKQFPKIQENPFGVGKPLGFPWFRELKNSNYRVYYLIYELEVIALFVGVSDKKNQQKVIGTIKEYIPYFKEQIKTKENNINSKDI